MRKTLVIAYKVLQLSWQANGFLTPLTIFANIYQNTLFPFLQVFLLAQVLDQIQAHNLLQLTDLAPYAIAYIVFSAINTIANSYANLQGFLFDSQFESYIDRLIIKKLTTLDPQTFEKPAFQLLLTEIEGTKGTIIVQITRITGFINAITKVLTAMLVLLPTFPIFIPLVLVSVLPSYYLGDVTRKKLWPFFSTKRSVVIRITDYVKNLLSQENTSKEAAIFGTGPVLRQKVIGEQKSFYRGYHKINDPFINKILAANLFQIGVFLYTQFLNAKAVISGVLGVGQFTMAFQQTQNLATGSQAVLDMYSSMLMRVDLIEKFYTFLDYKPAIITPIDSISLPPSPKPPTIEFRNVSFRYPKSERDILKNFSVTIQSGEKIALVGENGAGKTTIIKLLLRFYDVTAGEILINGVNIRQLSLDEWHKQVGALFQDFIKYQFTFKENIYYGNLDVPATPESIKEAISKSGAKTYLHTLPDGIDQIVGKMFKEGMDLSGGQWQKLALARAFFRNAPILILDEPTSAIDAKAELEIFENVQKLQKDKIVIIISHRFSTVRNADRILVLEGGKIIEEGNHEKLMKEKGLYAELFEIQAQGYK